MPGLFPHCLPSVSSSSCSLSLSSLLPSSLCAVDDMRCSFTAVLSHVIESFSVLASRLSGLGESQRGRLAQMSQLRRKANKKSHSRLRRVVVGVPAAAPLDFSCVKMNLILKAEQFSAAHGGLSCCVMFCWNPSHLRYQTCCALVISALLLKSLSWLSPNKLTELQSQPSG